MVVDVVKTVAGTLEVRKAGNPQYKWLLLGAGEEKWELAHQ